MAQNRADYAALIAPMTLRPEGLAKRRIQNIEGPGGILPLWIFNPPGEDRSRSVVVFYRGSGMCMGNMNLYEGICERLCLMSGAVVVAPDYRLAPECRFPAGLDDAYASLVWTSRFATDLGGDPRRLAVVGDSAGGMLAAVVALQARDAGGPPIALQVLICPALGVRSGSKSLAAYGKGYLLDRLDLAWLYQQYVDDPEQEQDPRVSPIHADNLSNLPSTVVILAGYDIMRDDAEDYCKRLRAAAVEVESTIYETTIHPFFNMADVIALGKDAIDQCARQISHRLKAVCA